VDGIPPLLLTKKKKKEGPYIFIGPRSTYQLIHTELLSNVYKSIKYYKGLQICRVDLTPSWESLRQGA